MEADNKPPFDHANLDNRIAALEIMTRLVIDSLSGADLSALSLKLIENWTE